LHATFTALRSAGQCFTSPLTTSADERTKDKNLLQSFIEKSQLVQKLNRIAGDDRRFASPPAAAKLHVSRRVEKRKEASTCFLLLSNE
jgi:hypothetical protein